MSEHPIEGLMTTAMENLKDMVDVNTIIGDPVESPDGSVIITVSRVGFGFAAGGSEFNGAQSGDQSESSGSSDSSSSSSFPFGGGSGGGVSITPIAFLVVNEKGVQMIHLNQQTHLYEKLLEFAPKALEKIQEIMQNSGQQGSKNDKGKDDSKEKGEKGDSKSKKKAKQEEDEDEE
ncbi:GerW family sporulation protein [Sediminibacillus massiliensis]|uniref:GerW family sporulation protein n=1 Tax=Sediminibacillus massiliensis TaxID=1926277 RepID=UPI00098830AB|nr:GerW family sporulation protein [Sediminibacillus massiliensis]